MDYTWTKTAAGAVRMVCGLKDDNPLVVEATAIEIDVSKVKVRLTVYVGSDVAWEDTCNLVRDADRARVVRMLKEKKQITLAEAALMALLQACRAVTLPRNEPRIETATADPSRVVPLPELLAEVEVLIQRYVVIGAEALTAVALWVAHTYVLDAFEMTPYLNVTSPAKRCGKSRLLEILDSLVLRAWWVERPSEAVLFRKVARDVPTLLLDEVDAIFRDRSTGTEGLRALLNAGNRRGVTVPRCVGDKQEIVDFPIFCAKAVAGIGSAVPDTVRDRSIEVRLARKKRTEKGPRLRAPILQRESAPTREALTAWAASRGTVAALRAAEPSLPDELHDRAADAWEPLLAIADLAAGAWPTRARDAARALHRADLEKDNASVLLLRAIRDVFEAEKVNRMLTVDLLHHLIERDGEPWGAWWGPAIAKDDTRGPGYKLAGHLREYGIMPKEMRTPNGKGKGYEAADFGEAWERYASAPRAEPAPEPSPPPNDATTRQPAPDAGLRAENDATARSPVPSSVASSNGAETLAAQGLSRCRVVDGGAGASGETGTSREPGEDDDAEDGMPTGPCRVCRTVAWWRQASGLVICLTCHPPVPGAP